MNAKRSDARDERMLVDEILCEQHPHEVAILLTKRDELARSQVVPFNAPSGALASVLVLNPDETVLPSVGQDRNLQRHAVHVNPNVWWNIENSPRAPSMSSALSGLFFGIISASTD